MSFITDLEGDDNIKLRIWGGDGDEDEEDDEDVDQDDDDDDVDDSDEDDKPKPKAKRTPSKDADDDDEDDDDDDDDDEDDKDKELARIKRENIRLKRAAEAKKTKDEKDIDLQKKYDRLIAKDQKRTVVMENNLLETAIMRDKKYDWIDAEDVVNAIKRGEINIDLDSGEIDGLDLELKRIAKKKPHWLKTGDDGDADQGKGGGRGNQGGGRRPPPPGTGGHPFGGVPRKEIKDKDALMAKYKIGSPLRSVGSR